MRAMFCYSVSFLRIICLPQTPTKQHKAIKSHAKRLKRTLSSRNPTLDMCAGLLVLLHRAGPGSKAEKTAMKIFTDMFEASAAEHLLRC